MKTLDEVVKALEYCTGFDFVRCQDCPGYSEPDCRTQDDALHYLRAFRDAKDTLEREKDRYAEAVKNCERAENIYKLKQKAAEDALWIYKEDKDDLTALRAYRKEQQANPSLTWDELRQMEGEPIWMEYDDHFPGRKGTKFKEWEVINCIFDDRIVAKGGWDYHKNEQGTIWQAYRKERSK